MERRDQSTSPLRRAVQACLLAVFLAAGAVLGSCGGCLSCGDDPPSTPPPPGAGTLMADFFLQDVNANSPGALGFVSPRYHLGKASAWYFGHST